MKTAFILSQHEDTHGSNVVHHVIQILNFDPLNNAIEICDEVSDKTNVGSVISTHATYAEAEAVVDNIVRNNTEHIKLGSADIEQEAV